MANNPVKVYLALMMFVLAIVAMFTLFFIIASQGMGWGV